jgi:tRNA(fMet)-specific endonuclease VapC
MIRYLLDANTISEAVRNPGAKVDQKLRQAIDQEIGTSIVVSAELRYGLKKNPGFRHREIVMMFLDLLKIWPITPPVDERYADIRLALRQGQTIGPNDLWIAAHALALDAVLVTDNEREFSRVPGLKLENWVR